MDPVEEEQSCPGPAQRTQEGTVTLQGHNSWAETGMRIPWRVFRTEDSGTCHRGFLQLISERMARYPWEWGLSRGEHRAPELDPCQKWGEASRW